MPMKSYDTSMPMVRGWLVVTRLMDRPKVTIFSGSPRLARLVLRLSANKYTEKWFLWLRPARRLTMSRTGMQ